MLTNDLIFQVLIYIIAFGFVDILFDYYKFNRKQKIFFYILLLVIAFNVFKK